MKSPQPRFSRLRLLAASLACCMAAATVLWAKEQSLRVRTFNPAHAPVLLKDPQATLIEEFVDPGEEWSPGARRSRVNSVNNPRVSVFTVKGQVECANQSSQTIEAVGLTVVSLDAFHERTQSLWQSASSNSQHTDLALARWGSKTLSWTERASSRDLYELAIVVRAVRFADGSVWQAPQEELVDVF